MDTRSESKLADGNTETGSRRTKDIIPFKRGWGDKSGGDSHIPIGKNEGCQWVGSTLRAEGEGNYSREEERIINLVRAYSDVEETARKLRGIIRKGKGIHGNRVKDPKT